jgi:hypothetical protein
MSIIAANKKEGLMDTDTRFDRLEAKLDKMVDALSQLVVVETKIDHLNEQQVTQNKRLDSHSNRLDKLSIAAVKASGIGRILERLGFVVVTCLVGYFFSNYSG